MPEVIKKQGLFNAKYTMQYLINKRNRQFTKYLQYQTEEEWDLSFGWLVDSKRCDDAIDKLLRAYPELEKFDDRQEETGERGNKRD